MNEHPTAQDTAETPEFVTLPMTRTELRALLAALNVQGYAPSFDHDTELGHAVEALRETEEGFDALRADQEALIRAQV